MAGKVFVDASNFDEAKLKPLYDPSGRQTDMKRLTSTNREDFYKQSTCRIQSRTLDGCIIKRKAFNIPLFKGSKLCKFG